MKKLLIVGSSWSAGTWKSEEPGRIELDQPGLQLLSDKFEVVNLSRAGSSNWQSLNTIKNYFDRINDELIDNTDVLLGQTDMFLDKMSNLFDVNYSDLYKRSVNFEHFYLSASEIFYYKLDIISKIIKKPIHIIGESADVDVNLLHSITNRVNVICSSWIKLFKTDHHESLIPLVINKNFLPTAKKNQRLDIAMQGTEYSDLNFKEFMELQESEYMGNFIGDFHPTSSGHDLMSRKILSYFNV